MTVGKLILLPTDGSSTAEAAARFAADIARAEQDTILVLAVAERAVFDHMEDAGVTAALHDYMTEIVTAEAARIGQEGIDTETLVVDAGSPHEAILRVAEERDVSLIVMGTHGRSALVRAVIGSVADRIVRSATVPVVLVPTKVEA